MYLTLIILPLLGSIASGFFGRKIGVTGAHIITSVSVITTTLLSIIVFIEVGINNIPVSLTLFRWIDSESLNVLWEFRFDSLTVSMLIPVLIVSSLVHIYSIGYMNGDPHNQRFFSYLSLFTFMMIILVTANNFLLMFVGWEGVGVCSYLLVNFWYTRIAANQSSISALLTNRVGDCFLTVGMFAMLWTFGNIDYSTIFSLAPFINENIVTIIGICLLIGAMAKSSQVGLHVWLPMAMEGPTPVSALIHAATMVTAGVYLLMRCSPLIEYSSTVLLLCLWLGAITTVFSSLIGLFQQDIKKVIAYSTMSQLGMMVIAVGLSSYNIALFHLVNHAFYKALLFLGAGSVIHAVSDNQDFRKYGGLKPFLPLTYSVMFIASLSLVAFPFMTGFYSKDFILETSYGQYSFSGTIVYFIAVIAAMFTTMYSVKVLYLTFITNPNGSLVDYKHVHESDIFMSAPLIILAVFSIFFGFIAKDMFIGVGSDFFSDNALFILPSNEILLDTEFAVPTLFKLLPLILTVSLSILFIFISEFLPKILIRFKLSYLGYNVFSFFNQRFYIELLYNKYITNLVLKLGGQTSKILDKGSVEFFGPYGLEKIFSNLSNKLSKLDTGVVTSYALYILVGSVLSVLFANLSEFGPFLIIFILTSLFLKDVKEYKLDNHSFYNIYYRKKLWFVTKREFSTTSRLCNSRNLHNKFFTWKKLKILFFTAIFTTIFSFLLRYIIYKYLEINIFDIINYPSITFASIFIINCFRIAFKILLETYLDYNLVTITDSSFDPNIYHNTIPKGKSHILAMNNNDDDPSLGSSTGVRTTPRSSTLGSSSNPISIDSSTPGSSIDNPIALDTIDNMISKWKGARDAIHKSIQAEQVKIKRNFSWRPSSRTTVYTPVDESHPNYQENKMKINQVLLDPDPAYYKSRPNYAGLDEDNLKKELDKLVDESNSIREELKASVEQTVNDLRKGESNLSPDQLALEHEKRKIDKIFYNQIDKIATANMPYNKMRFQEFLNDLALHDYAACAIKLLDKANASNNLNTRAELQHFVKSSNYTLHSLNYNFDQMHRLNERIDNIAKEKLRNPNPTPTPGPASGVDK